MEKIKFAFHVHSSFSSDSWSRPKDIVSYCHKRGIKAIAICDHNEIAGAIETQKTAAGDPYVIICEEIRTQSGEIIGMFLSERIAPGLAVEQTIKEIKKQGGLVCLPHPGETFRKESISREKIEEIIDQVDIIEVYNSRTLLSEDNKWALQLASQKNKLQIVGSDAHFLKDISKTINRLDLFEDIKDFVVAMKLNDISLAKKEKTGLFPQFTSKMVKILKRLLIDLFDRN